MTTQVFQNGVLIETIDDREFEQKQADVSKEVSRIRDGYLAGGYSHDFGEPHGVKALQTRPDDRTNWLTSQAAYSAAIAAGAGNMSGAVFRTEDNVTIGMTYMEGLTVLLAMAAWGQSVMARSWDIKDEIESATDETELAAVDIESGWP